MEVANNLIIDNDFGTEFDTANVNAAELTLA